MATLVAGAPLLAGGPPGWLAYGVLAVVTIGGAYVVSQSTSGAESAANDHLSDEPTTDVCATCPPPECGPILAEIRRLTEEVRFRHDDLRFDRHGLFRSARRIRDAGPHGSWDGHIRRMLDDRSRLRTEIAFADAKGCPVDPDSRRVAELDAPTRPDR